MRNHYIPRFIIKGFGERTNVFDIDKGVVMTDKRPKRIFYGKDVYTDELERISANDVDSPFCHLLEDKLESSNNITLSRKDLSLIKRYMAFSSVRIGGEERFFEMFRSYDNKIKRLLSMYEADDEKVGISALKSKKSLYEMEGSRRDIYMSILSAMCESEIPYYAFDDRIPKEVFAWAMSFQLSYVGIWDCPEGMEFILSDCPMHSEYETFYQLTGGISATKDSYLQYQIAHEKDEYKQYALFKILCANGPMYENLDFFPISKTRMLIAINPFFHLYFPHSFINPKGEDVFLNSPDVWPSALEQKMLFAPPTATYGTKGQYSEDDLFHYEKKVLLPSEVDYLNFIITGDSKSLMAFDKKDNVVDSICFSLWAEANYRSVDFVGEELYKILLNLINQVKVSRLAPLVDFLRKEMGDKQIDGVSEKLEAMIKRLHADFREDPYVGWWISKNKEVLKINSAFGFIGDYDKRVAYFKALASKIPD